MQIKNNMGQSSNLVRPLPASLSSSSSVIILPPKRRIGSTPILISCVLFWFVMCLCLLGALVYVGKIHSKSADSVLLSLADISSADSTNNNSVILSEIDHTSGNNSRKVQNQFDNDSDMAHGLASQLSFRLQREVRPLLYKLELHPNLKTKVFSGTVVIDIQVEKPVPFITLHSKKLQIRNVSLIPKLENASPAVISATYPMEKYEFWITEFEKPIDAGDYKFSMDFEGDLMNRIVGFYASTYFSPEKNATRTIATSKFEPTYARQAFPCFDEPAKKAEFQVSIVRPTGDDYFALSNMNAVEEIEMDGNLTKTVFAKSVPMSTYLSCFIVCDFAKTSAVIDSNGTGQNFELRLFAPQSKLQNLDLALKAAKVVTEHYIQYFGIEYPLPKLDLIAIPDFVSGAMEHWGLVTFRETALLFDEAVSSSANKQRVVSVVAHELAHQWFGNLVTMEFWNDLWLNEGFATYIQYRGTDMVFPEWRMSDQFLIDDFNRVVGTDSTLATHPIIQNVSNADQITEIFDTITYSKGATIIRMLEDTIGEDNFRKSVTSYLNNHKYGNAVTNDLLGEIEKMGFDFDIKYIMETWTKQSGFPVVNVIEVEPGKYRLTQKRFFSNPDNEFAKSPPSEFNYRWHIPITYTSSGNSTVRRTWFPNQDQELLIDNLENHDWIKFNKDQMGCYLVNYSEEMWNRLSQALLANFDTFSVLDRGELLNDAFTLSDASQLNYHVALNMTRYLVKEDKYVPWDLASTNLMRIFDLLYHDDVLVNVKKFGLQLVDQIYSKLGWNVVAEDVPNNLLRTVVMGLACRSGHEDCLKRIGTEFNNWLENPLSRPSPDLRSLVYSHGMRVYGNETTWNKVWELFRKELDAQESLKLLSSLANVQDSAILRRFITLAWDEENVRRQDYFTCLAGIASNPVGEPLVWEYVRNNWPAIVDRFGLNERYLGNMIPAITRKFSTPALLAEMQEFFSKYPDAGAGANARNLALETVQSNIKWLEKNRESVTDWFKVNVPM